MAFIRSCVGEPLKRSVSRKGSMKWEPYDPEWLVDLALRQRPADSWLADALRACTTCSTESDAYIHFVDPVRPNEPGSEWQHEACIILDDPEHGEVVLDILKNHRIGGAEFLWKL